MFYTRMSNYFSFLTCQHREHADVYLNGIPLGVVRGDKFVRRTVEVNGVKKLFDLTSIPDCPVDNLIDLARFLRVLATQIERAAGTDIKINGEKFHYDGPTITYEEVCFMADEDPARCPSMTLSYTNREGRTLCPGESAEVLDGARFTVVVTGSA